ncbi:LiaF transmembrane domain-containing protein [Candidatus Clostridium stratigraminis]|uniref:LiaF transmembrane domain-containing protein n=1 Tax=Candidatus Clostridium stratigraminis TaxID=3381661 RepID=A0ABW8T157_9CLOT
MKNRNWFWGVFFLLSAIFVILSQVWFFLGISVTSILASVFLAALAISSLLRLEYFGTFIPLSILYIIYSKPLKLFYISPWLLISSALLISISFSLLFPKRKKKKLHFYYSSEKINHASENIDNNNPYVKVSLNSASKYVHSDDLHGGQFISNLGVLDVYFDQVKISSEGAKIFIDCNLGSINLYIPKDWRLNEELHSYLGEVKYHNNPTNLPGNAPKVTLTGKVVLGDVKIFYI